MIMSKSLMDQSDGEVNERRKEITIEGPFVSSSVCICYVFHNRPDLSQIFDANNESMMPVTNSFRPALRGRYFRIHPQTWHRRIAMRVELYTCASGQ